MSKDATLYIVATPIGNLEDITLRALRVLKEVGRVFAEDTRVTRKLFSHYGIKTPLERFDAQVEAGKIPHILRRIGQGESVAVVSDAGTPAISDPGARLVRAAYDAGYRVVAIPGASALSSALSISGVVSESFCFLGFVPRKKGRKTFFEKTVQANEVMVFYESVHRLMKTLTQLAETFASQSEGKLPRVIVAHEMTKLHEEVIAGTPDEVLLHFKNNPKTVRGEFVVIVDPNDG